MAWYDQFKDARILIHQDSGKDGIEHNKFWFGHLDDKTSTVHTRWGRLGTKGQSQSKQFGDTYAAANYLDKKYREKRGKGYRDQLDGKPIDKAILDRLHTEATIVGTGNKLSRFQWMEQIESPGGSPNFIEINEDRLYDPACNPAIFIELITKKEYDGMTHFRLIFTGDGAYHVDGRNGQFSHLRQIDSTDPLHKLTEKVEEAIGRRFSGADE